tara:strand:+ start:2293 stop:2529 length:237 start_codon:yes stop_codon:yes gene_type:complete
MNYKQIIKTVSEQTNVPIYAVETIVNKTFSSIKSLLIKDTNIMLRGYFKFVTSKRKYYKKPDKLKVEQIIKLPNKNET